MGNGCCKEGSAVDVSNPPPRSVQQHRNQHNNPQFELESMNVPNVSNNNVNQRYSQYFEIIRDKHSGTGLKRTLAYISKIPKEEIDRKRAEYWETRVEGNSTIWQALRGACEADEETALAILSAMSIKPINKNLQKAYDSQGFEYDVPIFCINDPVQYDIPKKKQIRKEDLQGQSVLVKIRRVGVPHDVELQIPKDVVVLTVKEEYIRKVKEEGLQPANLRLFYGGRELIDANLLAEYGLDNEHVIQVFVRK